MSTITDSSATLDLLARASDGDGRARAELLTRHADLLLRSVARRIDTKLQARVDASDIVQETQLEIMNRLDDYLRRRPMPFRLWVIKTAHQRLLKVERQHLATAKRAVDREVPLPDRSSLDLAAGFLSREPSPDRALSIRETARRVRQILAELSEADREILMLRNFENLSNAEAAALLELQPETAKKRYTRALLRLERRFTECGLTGGSV